MPRKTISSDYDIDYLEILDEDGEVDEDLVPDFDPELLIRGYRAMVLARRFDEQRLKLQRSGRIGTFAPVNGQEAAQIGTISAIDPKEDWFVPSYRETAAALWRGAKMSDMLVFDAGYNEGAAVPDGARDLPNAVPVGTQMLQAAGIGYAARQEDSDEIVMTYFGDGATSQGDFHEALNFAAVFSSPVVFVCQNNQYAISVPRSRQTHSETLAQKAIAYGLPGIQVDGNDIFACFVAADEAAKRARQESTATLIECVTYRQEMHTTADDPTRYREDEEVDKWMKRDPIRRFDSYLVKNAHLDDETREKMEKDIAAEIDKAWEEAEKIMEELDPVAPMFDHIYAEMPDELAVQRKRMIDGGSPGLGPDG